MMHYFPMPCTSERILKFNYTILDKCEPWQFFKKVKGDSNRFQLLRYPNFLTLTLIKIKDCIDIGKFLNMKSGTHVHQE